MAVIAVDVDGTVLTEICYDWFYWLKERYKLKPEWSHVVNPKLHVLPYNLLDCFELPHGVRDLSFWHSNDLYDKSIARYDALQYLSLLNTDHNIIFISKVIGNHGLSKTNFINRWFPYHDGIVFTAEKYLVNCDYLIDDSAAVLDTMPASVKTIKFRADFSEAGVSSKRHRQVYCFEEVFKYIVGEENDRLC